MGKECFKAADADSPICGVHRVPLSMCRKLIAPEAPFLGYIECLHCPAGDRVVVNGLGFPERLLATQW